MFGMQWNNNHQVLEDYDNLRGLSFSKVTWVQRGEWWMLVEPTGKKVEAGKDKGRDLYNLYVWEGDPRWLFKTLESAEVVMQTPAGEVK